MGILTDHGMIGDPVEMYCFAEYMKKLISELENSRADAFASIDKMGEGYKDATYVTYKEEFIEFSKFIDEINDYFKKSAEFYYANAEVVQRFLEQNKGTGLGGLNIKY